MNFTKSASHVSIAGIFSSGMIFGAACDGSGAKGHRLHRALMTNNRCDTF